MPLYYQSANLCSLPVAHGSCWPIIIKMAKSEQQVGCQYSPLLGLLIIIIIEQFALFMLFYSVHYFHQYINTLGCASSGHLLIFVDHPIDFPWLWPPPPPWSGHQRHRAILKWWLGIIDQPKWYGNTRLMKSGWHFSTTECHLEITYFSLFHWHPSICGCL